PATWLGKSEQPMLAYATVLEMVAEQHRASPALVKRLNPEVDWNGLLPGAVLNVPAVGRINAEKKAAQLVIRLSAHELEAMDGEGAVIAHFPVSIARMVERRPLGELHVVVAFPNPNYTFDPEVFPESAEGKELGRKLI